MTIKMIDDKLAALALGKLKKHLENALSPIQTAMHGSSGTTTIQMDDITHSSTGNSIQAHKLLHLIQEKLYEELRDKFINNEKDNFMRDLENLKGQVKDLEDSVNYTE